MAGPGLSLTLSMHVGFFWGIVGDWDRWGQQEMQEHLKFSWGLLLPHIVYLDSDHDLTSIWDKAG